MKLLVALILAHSWYPERCCQNENCHRVPCDEITILSDGSGMWNNLTVKPENALSTQDGYCHICTSHSDRVLYCVFTRPDVS